MANYFLRGVIVKWKNRMRHKPELKGTKQDMTPFLLSPLPSFFLSFLEHKVFKQVCNLKEWRLSGEEGAKDMRRNTTDTLNF